MTSFINTNWGENSKLILKQLTHKSSYATGTGVGPEVIRSGKVVSPRKMSHPKRDGSDTDGSGKAV